MRRRAAHKVSRNLFRREEALISRHPIAAKAAPREDRRWRRQGGLSPKDFGTGTQSVSGATTFLCWQGGFPDFVCPFATTPSLTRYYRCRDYTPLPNRSPCHEPPNCGWPVPPVPGSLSREKPFPRGNIVSGGLCPPCILAKPASAAGREVCGAKRIRSLYLPLSTGRLPGFCTFLRYSDKPYSILSMLRLCAFEEQTSLPRVIRTEPAAWREGHRLPPAQQVARA
jgi:hypothetical protein